MFADAEQCYRHALAIAKDTANVAAEGKALTDLAQTLAWYRPSEALTVADRAREVNQEIRNQVELVKVHAAVAVAATLTYQYDRATTEIEHGLLLTQECGYPGGQIWCWAARAFLAVARSDDAGYGDAVARVEAISDELGGNRFWADIVAWWTDQVSTAGPAQWIDGEDSARSRWKDVTPGA
ncbi:MAG TPA: hypothetical protein VFX16_31895 [Pseudonocardiaceae bacterium]|nr:hypothetical protein [Pseudonocardiaceae bacterium]